MTQLWCEQQREALRAFRKAVARRSQRELAIAEDSLVRAQGTEKHYAAEKQRVESEHAAGQMDALNRAEQTRQQTQARHDKETNQLQKEYTGAKEQITADYQNAKAALEAEFRESRWTTFAVYEADKRTAK